MVGTILRHQTPVWEGRTRGDCGVGGEDFGDGVGGGSRQMWLEGGASHREVLWVRKRSLAKYGRGGRTRGTVGVEEGKLGRGVKM